MNGLARVMYFNLRLKLPPHLTDLWDDICAKGNSQTRNTLLIVLGQGLMDVIQWDCFAYTLSELCALHTPK